MKIQVLISSVLPLSMISQHAWAEFWIVNYGVEGQCEPHYDFQRIHVNDVDYKINGSRIATFLNYMSVVEAGGATVFPDIGSAVQPKKFLTNGSEKEVKN